MINKLSTIDWIAVILVSIGGLNWGLVGAFEFDLVATIFGDLHGHLGNQAFKERITQFLGSSFYTNKGADVAPLCFVMMTHNKRDYAAA